MNGKSPPWRPNANALVRALSVAALFLVAWLGHVAQVQAHSVGLSRGDYRVSGAQVAVQISFARAELTLALPEFEQVPESGTVVPDPALRALRNWIQAGLRIESDRGACSAALERAELTENDGMALWLRYECPAAPLELKIFPNFLASVSSGHRHLAHVSYSGVTRDEVLQRTSGPLRIGPFGADAGARHAGEVGNWSRFAGFFRMGLDHILTGYDHLVFLVGLLLILGPVRSLLWAITAFTAAHSLTLTLSTLGVACPSSRLIEPLIALSIVYVGVENWFVRDAVGRWRLTFLFGLIHGFGFASALSEVAVPRGELLTALFSFNLGVEAGQLAIVAVLLPTLLLLRQNGWLGAKRPQWLSLGVSAAGLLWLVSRLHDLA